MSQCEDLTGQRFTRLTVKSRIEGAVKPMWLCLCDCGNQCRVVGERAHVARRGFDIGIGPDEARVVDQILAGLQSRLNRRLTRRVNNAGRVWIRFAGAFVDRDKREPCPRWFGVDDYWPVALQFIVLVSK